MTGPIRPLVIVGAGPHALAVVSALVERDRRWADEVTVLDPAGTWLAGWRHRFGSHEITSLRSAAVHHPHPDPHRLRVHALEGDRLDELSPPYDQPSTDLFDDFCDTLIAGARQVGRVERQRVTAVDVLDGGVVRLGTARGDEIWAERVVLATNAFRRHLPPEASAAGREVAWCHSDDVDLRLLASCERRRIDVVGGGLTAVQLACGAARRGAEVRLLSRRQLRTRAFDVQPGWLGPKKLEHYRRSSPRTRRRLIDEARGGGSVPAHDLEALCAADVDAVVTGDPTTDALAGEADTVWFATGSRLDATTDPLLSSLRASHPATMHAGLPQLAADLSWPGTRVHLVGGYAALELGPASRNLWGARFAAARIAAAAVDP